MTPGSSTFTGTGSTYTLNVAITWCSDVAFNTATRSITLDGVDVSGSFAPSGTVPMCPFAARWAGNVVLTGANDGVHVFAAGVEDVNGWFGAANATYTFQGSGYTTPTHDVRVEPVSHAVDAAAGTSRSVQFRIHNLGSRPGTYSLSRTCLGAATCTGLSPTSVSLDTTAAGRTASATVTLTSGAAGDTGVVRLRATNTTFGASTDSASTDVFIAPASTTPTPGVALVGAGDVTERGLCLTMSTGAGAAYECGDLRLAHALPTVTTRGQARTPVLLYNSAHAGPVQQVAADVAPGATVPQTVEARVLVGGVVWGSASWPGSQWTANSSRRITVPVTTSAATGLHGFTLEVKYLWSGGGQTITNVTGWLPVVNRSASPLGAGWWLAGLEQLVLPGDGSLAWIGGDGSTRRYASAGANLWRAANVTRPDSIQLVGTTYVRRLPDGTRVEFNSTGQHVATRPLAGSATHFQYTGGGALSRIVVPTALADGNTTVRYDFTYHTDSVVATLTTTGGVTRRTRAALASGRVTTIRDPDGSSVQFGYGTGTSARRVASRTDRRGYTTQFTFDAANHLTAHSLTIPGQTIARSFQPAESRGAPGTTNGVAQPVDSAYTLVDGPRTDVADVMRFWLDQYGGVRKLRDAHGYYTTVVPDATWPALAAEVRTPGGAITRAWYDARGLVDSTKTMNFRGTGDASGTTRYHWHATLALPDSVKGAGGDVMRYGYNADGTVAWVQPGNDASARSSVAYYGSGGLAGLYRASSVPGRTERDSVTYDATLGNPISFRDRSGYWSHTDRDALGRVERMRTQLAAGLWRTDTLGYDLADRVTRLQSAGPTVPYTLHAFTGSGTVPADTLVVRTSYDAEGNPTQVARWARPNRAALDTLKTSYLHDGAGRQTSEWSSSGADLTLSYDPAGNLVQQQGYTGVVSMAYDALGRLTRRISERQTYFRTPCSQFVPWGAGMDCDFSFPLSTAGSLKIPGDTAEYRYDAAGNMVRADNMAARIRRSYSPAGLLLADTLRTRILRYEGTSAKAVAQDFTSHVYGIRHEYDQAGRPAKLWHPATLAECGAGCPAQLYAHDAPTGRLASVTDVRGKAVSFLYDWAGQLSSLTYPGGIVEDIQYDADGQPRVRTVGTSALKFIRDTLTRDPLGRVTRAAGLVVRDGASQTVHNVYSGLGALAEMEHGLSFGTPRLEEFRSDALGNQVHTLRRNLRLGPAADNPSIRASSYDAQGRLSHVTSPPDSLEYQEFRHSWYDASGRLQFEGGMTGGASWSGPTDITQSAHYYDGEGRLALYEGHVGDLLQASAWNDPRGVMESYRYDALGRRVLRRSLRLSCTAPGCESTVERYVWDGAQLLYETRGRADSAATTLMVESDSPSGNGQYGAPNAYGVVGYTHAGGIDRPLGVMRRNTTAGIVAFWPQANWRGLYETGTKDDGTRITNAVDWPGASASAYLGATPRTAPYEWFGSLMAEHADASGLMYRRNRYFDPRSGRFTQPDPIGIAGGVNVYGFAGGDPVSYRDPFGLCVPDCLIDFAFIAADLNDIRKNGLTWGKGAALGVDVLAAAVPFVPAGAGAGLRAVTRATASKVLGRSLVAAGHARQAGDAAHHVVAFEAKSAASARGVLKRFGIDVNDAANGLFLPGGQHARIHTGGYYDEVNSRLGAAESRGEALEILDQIKRDVQSGSFPRD